MKKTKAINPGKTPSQMYLDGLPSSTILKSAGVAAPNTAAKAASPKAQQATKTMQPAPKAAAPAARSKGSAARKGYRGQEMGGMFRPGAPMDSVSSVKEENFFGPMNAKGKLAADVKVAPAAAPAAAVSRPKKSSSKRKVVTDRFR